MRIGKSASGQNDRPELLAARRASATGERIVSPMRSTSAPGTSSPQQAGLQTMRCSAANSPNEIRWLTPSMLVSWALRWVRSSR